MVSVKKYDLFCRQDREKECAIVISELEQKGWRRDHKNPAVVVVMGGDGSFLEAVHQYFTKKSKVKFLFINEGYLGFFSGVERNDRERALTLLDQDNLPTVKISIMNIHHNNKDYFSINEFKTVSLEKTAKWEVKILNRDDKEAAVYREELTGSGLVLATTLGSNGLNRSLGGAIVSPEIEVIQYTKLAPVINKLTSSLPGSLILSKDSKICIKKVYGEKIVNMADNIQYVPNDENEIIISLREEKLDLLVLNEKNFFYNKVRKVYNLD